MYCIDCLNDQCTTSIFDLYPLVSRLTGCSLIEFFGHWLSKWEAERQSITVQVTWPSLGDVLYQDAFSSQRLTGNYTLSHTIRQRHLHTHCPGSTDGSVVSDNSSSTEGEQCREKDWPTWHYCSFWDKAERNRDAVALLSSFSVTFSLTHTHAVLAFVLVKALKAFLGHKSFRNLPFTHAASSLRFTVTLMSNQDLTVTDFSI